MTQTISILLWHFSLIVDRKICFTACGTGKSRDYARNSAALSILDKLIDTKYFGNVIGRLQELCARIKWPPPKYSCEMTARMKIINENVFVVVCSVKQYKEIGQGRSKKMAKLFAAYKMWHKLTGKAWGNPYEDAFMHPGIWDRFFFFFVI